MTSSHSISLDEGSISLPELSRGYARASFAFSLTLLSVNKVANEIIEDVLPSPRSPQKAIIFENWLSIP